MVCKVKSVGLIVSIMAAEMDDLSWKEKKEHFVSGLTGTSVFEVLTVTSFFPLFVLLRAILFTWTPVWLLKNYIFRFLFDFTILVFPIVLIVTKLSEVVNQLLILVCITEASILFIFSRRILPTEKEDYISYVQFAPKSVAEKTCYSNSLYLDDSEDQILKQLQEPSTNSIRVMPRKMPFLKSIRSYISIATCICILAVDFHVFPRRFAKAEEFGSGLMDVGIGLFILSNAVVCREARQECNLPAKPQHHQLAFSALVHQLLSCWPILLLGFIRLISLALVGYNTHVSEYGVHWNFFFTLAVVKMLSSIILFFMPAKYSLLACLLIGGAYQFLLVSPLFNFTEILLNSNRVGLVMQNKEGIASCFGHLSLYFAGVFFGTFLFKPRSTLKEWQCAVVKVIKANVVLWCLLFVCEISVQPISRRLANLSYILWLMAHFSSVGLLFLMVDILIARFINESWLPVRSMPDKWLVMSQDKAAENLKYFPPPTALCLLGAINRNQLLYFLISNLATGFINGVIDSMKASDCTAVIVLCSYSLVTTSFIWYLNAKNVTFKYW